MLFREQIFTIRQNENTLETLIRYGNLQLWLKQGKKALLFPLGLSYPCFTERSGVQVQSVCRHLQPLSTPNRREMNDRHFPMADPPSIESIHTATLPK